MDPPLLGLPAPRLETRFRWWLHRAPGRLARELPRIAVSTLLLSTLFWGGYLTGSGTLESNALPMTFLRPDSPPDWLRQFATAFCRGDPAYIAAHLGGRYAGFGAAAIQAQFDAMHTSSADCESARYLGSLTGANGARQYIYVFDLVVVGQRSSVWFVFTTLSDRVVNIE